MTDHFEERRGFKYVRLKSGRLMSFWDVMRAADAADTAFARAVSRAFKLARDEWDFERIDSRLNAMEDYIAAVRAEIEKRRGIKTREERIALLRNTDGRTPEEAEAFLRKADELERELHTADTPAPGGKERGDG